MKTLLLVSILCLAGCSWAKDAYDRATSERVDGTVPAVELAKDAGKLYVNPADYVSWEDVWENIIYILAGGGVLAGGSVGMKKVLAKKKEGSTQ
jgi:hypothetical protein